MGGTGTGPRIVVAVFLLLVSAAGTSDILVTFDVEAYVTHSPIAISGNSQLMSRAVSEGWSGDGSEGSPYTITNYDIGDAGTGIRIENTDLHLSVYDCIVHDCSGDGILLVNVSNATVDSNLVVGNDADGIHLVDSTNVTVTENRFTAPMVMVSNYNHIVLDNSSCNRVMNNDIVKSQNDGIRLLEGSRYNLVSGNRIKNIYKGVAVIGQYNTVCNNTLDSNSYGVHLHTTNNTVKDNLFIYNAYGVYAYFSGHNTVNNCTFQRNYIGVYIIFTRELAVRDNFFLTNYNYGVYIRCDTDAENRVFLNSFFYCNNSGASYNPSRIQCYDMYGGNQWNTTDGRGNFWWDWRGPDSNGDGVVDQPYRIAGAGVYDHYPLTTTSIPDIMQPPRNVTMHPGRDHLRITWDHPAYFPTLAVTEYQIYRGFSAGSEDLVDRIDGNLTEYNDTMLESGERYFYYIIAVCDIGTSNRSARVSGVPDPVSPRVTITGPGDFVDSGAVTVRWESVDNVGVTHHSLQLDGGSLIELGAVTSYLFEGLEDGFHTVRVVARDLVGNENTTQGGFTVDTIDPGLNITGPSIEPYSNVNLTQFRMEWTGYDNGSGVEGYRVSLDGINWTDVGMDLQHTWDTINGRWHTPSVSVRDKAGNTAGAELTFFVDTGLPSLELNGPSGFIDRDFASVNWTAEDSETQVSGLELSLDLGPWMDVSNLTEWNYTELSDGPHEILLRVEDGAKNYGYDNVSFAVDTTAPLLIFEEPDRYLHNKTDIQVRWQVWDNTSGLKGLRIRLDEGEWMVPDLPFSHNFEGIPDGLHTFHIEAEDVAGNRKLYSTDIRVDTENPRVTLALPQGNAVSRTENITIRFSEEMDAETVLIKVNGAVIEPVWDDNTIHFDPSFPLAYGLYCLVVVQGRDIAGNRMNPYQWTFIVEKEDLSNLTYFFGKVMDHKGRPLEGVGVSINFTHNTRTDAYGYFKLEADPGTYSLKIAKDGYRLQEINGRLEEGEGTNLGEIRMESLQEEEKEDGFPILPISIAGVVVLFLLIVVLSMGLLMVREKRSYPMFVEDEGWMRMHPRRR